MAVVHHEDAESRPSSAVSALTSPERYTASRRSSSRGATASASFVHRLSMGGYHMTTSSELERENRHFVMSEAIIEAMEQAKQARSLPILAHTRDATPPATLARSLASIPASVHRQGCVSANGSRTDLDSDGSPVARSVSELTPATVSAADIARSTPLRLVDMPRRDPVHAAIPAQPQPHAESEPAAGTEPAPEHTPRSEALDTSRGFSTSPVVQPVNPAVSGHRRSVSDVVVVSPRTFHHEHGPTEAHALSAAEDTELQALFASDNGPEPASRPDSAVERMRMPPSSTGGAIGHVGDTYGVAGHGVDAYGSSHGDENELNGMMWGSHERRTARSQPDSHAYTAQHQYPPPAWRALSSSPASIAFGFLQSLDDAAADEVIRTSSRLLVSQEDEVPQALLPMPVASLGDMSGAYYDDDVAPLMQVGTCFRGNDEWAPPRNQIIFSVHVKRLGKSDAIKQQGHRCAGCGIRVELNYSKKFRYCEYLGKYFCTSCHSGETRIIPGRVLHNWDFRRYRVSNFSAQLLDSINEQAVFDFQVVNAEALRKVRTLATATSLRRQLCDLGNYLRACRGGAGLLHAMESHPHLATETTLYSMHDLYELRFGWLLKHITQLVEAGIAHVKDCPLCKAKGFICELCDKDADIIFPFELHKVAKCVVCRDVFHTKCFSKANKKCPKCERRQRRLAEKEAATLAALEAAVEADSGPTQSV